jgi:hypothetical protein
MEDTLNEKQSELAGLFERAAKLSAQIEREKATPGKVLHYSQIEGSAHNLGLRLSRAVQDEAIQAQSTDAEEHAECPDCGRGSPIKPQQRTILSVDGPVEIVEPVAHCRRCRRSFFPQREAMGLEERRLSPGVIGALVMLAGELRSFERAAVVYQRLCGGKVSAKTIQRLVAQIGPELVAERDADSGSCFEHRVESPPQTAVVQCDGGRIMTRAPGAAPGVHSPAWKETKCAGLFRMTYHPFEQDPQPRLPPAFRDRQKVAESVTTGRAGSMRKAPKRGR